MTTLTIFADDEPERVVTQTAQSSEIERLLGKAGVRFERWKAGADLAGGADQPAILAAYHPEVDRLMTEGGYKTADVI
ncbi:MAG: cupin, partial [Alphaproteobacteria bacterium]